MSQFKKHDIVVLTAKQKKLGPWNLGHRPGTVALVTHVKRVKPFLDFTDGWYYSVRFLSDSVTRGAPFGGGQLRLATIKEITKAICTGLLPEIDAHCPDCQGSDQPGT